jgi:putative transcriptional regulator
MIEPEDLKSMNRGRFGGLLTVAVVAAVALLLALWLTGGGGGAGDWIRDPQRGGSGFARPVQALDAPRPGSFLIAARSLRDPNFAQTVVFLLHYDSRGALGLIIDRPSSHTMAELWPEIAGLDAHTVYLGGPVSPGQLLFLLHSARGPQGTREVIQGVHLGSDQSTLRRILAEGAGQLRVYAGYSGWAAGQLDAEIARHDWHIMPAEWRFIFDSQPQEVWKELIGRLDTQLASLSPGSGQ